MDYLGSCGLAFNESSLACKYKYIYIYEHMVACMHHCVHVQVSAEAKALRIW